MPLSILKLRANTPRWVIVLMDVIIALIALSFAYLIRFDLKAERGLIITEWTILSRYLWVFVAVKLLVFFTYRIHQGLVRYTSLEDLKRIFYAVSTCSLIFLCTGYLRSYFDDRYFMFPTSVLIIEWMACFVFMAGIRFFVKLVYLETTKGNQVREQVLIYGAGVSGQITRRTITRDSKMSYHVVGFIDDNKKMSGKILEGKTIYHTAELERLIQQYGITRVILAIQHPDQDKVQDVLDRCLSLGVELQKIPSPKSWINGEFSTKQMSKLKIEDLLGRNPIVLDEDKIASTIANKVVLITGAAGSIGSGMVRQLARYAPSQLVLLDQAESPLYDLHIELLKEFPAINFEVVIGDIRSLHRMNKLFSATRPEFVFHAAAYKHVPLMEDNPTEAVLTNVKGTRNLVDLSVEYGVQKFVMVSTDKAVNPTNVMGASKRIAEIYAQAKNRHGETRFVTTRFGNVLGSNGSVIPLFQRQIEAGGPITVTDERITRFFMTIPEACQLVLEAGIMGEGGEIFVFDMGESVKIVDLAKKMIQLSGLELGKDIAIEFTGLRPGEKLYEELLANEEETIATHHPKILKAKVRQESEEVIEDINRLIELFDLQDNEQVVSQMKRIVPEFISNNSIFQRLDK